MNIAALRHDALRATGLGGLLRHVAASLVGRNTSLKLVDVAQTAQTATSYPNGRSIGSLYVRSLTRQRIILPIVLTIVEHYLLIMLVARHLPRPVEHHLPGVYV